MHHVAEPIQYIPRTCNEGLICLDRNPRLDDEMSIDIRYADETTLVSAVFEKLQILQLQS